MQLGILPHGQSSPEDSDFSPNVRSGKVKRKRVDRLFEP